MAALGEKIIVLAPSGDCLADQLFALHIALGSIDDIEPGVQGTIQKLRDGAGFGALEADLRAAETEDSHVHVGLAELTFFHGCVSP